MTKPEINEQIHLALGWTKVPWPNDGRDTIGCSDGWAWRSPAGQHYEGHAGMVPDYVATLAEAARILPALLTVCTSNNDLNMWGDDEASLVARCQPRLYDSETADPVTAEEIGITEAEYRRAIADSHETGTHEGHIRVNGRRVYAE
jgi:hypothetical protein